MNPNAVPTIVRGVALSPGHFIARVVARVQHSRDVFGEVEEIAGPSYGPHLELKSILATNGTKIALSREGEKGPFRYISPDDDILVTYEEADAALDRAVFDERIEFAESEIKSTLDHIAHLQRHVTRLESRAAQLRFDKEAHAGKALAGKEKISEHLPTIALAI